MNIWHVTDDEVVEGCSSVTGACNLLGADRHYTSEMAAIAAAGVSSSKSSNELTSLSSSQIKDLEKIKNNLKQLSNPEVYFHPQGKLIVVNTTNRSVRAYKAGVSIGTSATFDKLRAGHGAWKKLATEELTDFIFSK